MHYNVAGIKNYLQNDPAIAALYLDSAIYHVSGISMELVKPLASSRNIYRAEGFIQQGKIEAAYTAYKNLLQENHNGLLTSGGLWGFEVYRMGMLADEPGKKEEAIAYYKILVEAYRDADEKYQPWSDNAYTRLSELVGKPEAELRGKITTLD